MLDQQVRVGDLAPVVRKVDNATHRINRYPVDKCSKNILRYPFEQPGPGWGYCAMFLAEATL